MKNIKYVGMDVHKAVTVIAVLNEQGQVESLTRIKTKADNFRDYFRGLSGTTHVVLEEGGWSVWLYKLLKPLVNSVTVCETRHNKLIGAGNKSDDEDAETLARLLRLGELKAVYKGDDRQQQLREFFRTYHRTFEVQSDEPLIKFELTLIGGHLKGEAKAEHQGRSMKVAVDLQRKTE